MYEILVLDGYLHFLTTTNKGQEANSSWPLSKQFKQNKT